MAEIIDMIFHAEEDYVHLQYYCEEKPKPCAHVVTIDLGHSNDE